MLRVKALKAAYGDSQVLFDVSLEIQAGEMITLLGRNGMGKTTTVHSIMGLVRAHQGLIEFAGHALQHLPAYKIAQAGLALVPEGRQIFPNLTVKENLIATAANRLAVGAPWTLKAVLALFPSLQARLYHMGNLLSGGEQQMLAIARALMTNPSLLILDEATEGLAPLICEQIWQVLQQLKSQGQSILVIDKNIDALTKIADRHYILEKGKIIWQGDSSMLSADANIMQRYLGV